MEKIIRIPRGTKEQTPLFLSLSTDTSLKVILEDDTSLLLICLSAKAVDAPVQISQRATIGERAKLHLVNVTLGGKQISHDLVSHVSGNESESTIDWIFYGKDSEKQKLSARNIFDARNGRGEITVHGVAEDHAQSSFEGFIEITKNGGGTDTYLTEKTLMLDPTAKVNAVPGLEIKTNDVKASHSASISKVSDEDLFYFASRGIALDTARRMYVEGFLGALVETIPDANIREKILAEIARKYEKER